MKKETRREKVQLMGPECWIGKSERERGRGREREGNVCRMKNIKNNFRCFSRVFFWCGFFPPFLVVVGLFVFLSSCFTYSHGCGVGFFSFILFLYVN